ncbi:hypothetical protein [Rickettsia endosymbiont of Gonocerus acuteangulatus]|uniref:hypothetical protein n=1 Tax=Rickettsia endosymbiont of Gonocerus acuteangulatus TaxID=3066266 RepID=UPI0031333D92
MKSKPNILSTIFSKLLSVEEMANENLPSSANNVTDISGESQSLENNPNHDIVLLELY